MSLHLSKIKQTDSLLKTKKNGLDVQKKILNPKPEMNLRNRYLELV